MKSGYLFTKDSVVLRSDKKRTVIYFRDVHHLDKMRDLSDKNTSFTALSPDLATAFYLMDGTKDYQTISLFVKDYFKMNKNDFSKFNELLSGNLDVYYSSRPHPLLMKSQYDLNAILPNLNKIDDFDMSPNYLYYPYSFLLIPHMSCHVDCVYCYADKKHTCGPMAIEAWEKIIYEAAVKFKAKDISISGGDFFLYPQWKEFISILAGHRYFPELPTKTPLSREDQKFLYDLGFKSYQISLDTLNTDHLGQILQIRDPAEYVRQMIMSIESAESIGLQISINSIQTHLSYRDIFETMQQLSIYNNIYRIAIDAAEFSLYRNGMDSVMLQYDDVPEYLHQLELASRLFSDHDIQLKFNDDPIWVGKKYLLNEIDYMQRKHCNGGRAGIVILPDGKVTCCEELYWNEKYIIGDLTKQTFFEIFDSPERWNLITPQQSSMAPDSPCRNCDIDLFQRCTKENGRCWRESVKLFNRDDFPDYRCPFWERVAIQGSDNIIRNTQQTKIQKLSATYKER